MRTPWLMGLLITSEAMDDYFASVRLGGEWLNNVKAMPCSCLFATIFIFGIA